MLHLLNIKENSSIKIYIVDEQSQSEGQHQRQHHIRQGYGGHVLQEGGFEDVVESHGSILLSFPDARSDGSGSPAADCDEPEAGSQGNPVLPGGSPALLAAAGPSVGADRA